MDGTELPRLPGLSDEKRPGANSVFREFNQG
jgi:hypothetical protein